MDIVLVGSLVWNWRQVFLVMVLVRCCRKRMVRGRGRERIGEEGEKGGRGGRERRGEEGEKGEGRRERKEREEGEKGMGRRE